jgi:hypothetical protein
VFALSDPPADWPAAAPVSLERKLEIAATAEALFAVLADHEHWPSWFTGMRRARVEGSASGVGALRSVWVGPTRVRERFDIWEEGRRLRFAIVACNIPGLASMVEDWQIEPRGDHCDLTIAVGAVGAGPLRLVPGLVRQVISRSTRGAAGIAGVFS